MKRTILAGSTFVLAMSAVSALVTGCGSKQDPPPQQPAAFNGQLGPNGQPMQPAYGQPGDPNAGAYGQQPAQPYGAPPPPMQPGMPTAQQPAPPPPAAPAGTDPNTAALVRMALSPRASTEAKGMKEDGDAVGGMLQEGGVLTQEFTLQPGRCYTVLGQGLPPITELDLQVAPKPLIAGAPVLIPPVTDQTTGAAASISPGKNCYVNPTFLPVAVILTVKATKGSGPAGAQVYSRPK
jgi:hypothetical protein